MRVFVTGSTGLLGSHIAERLKASGHDVVALVRPTSDLGFLGRIGAELVEGDLLAPETYRDALGRCGAVVHAAALVTQPAGWEAYREVNVQGTRVVLEAAANAGVRGALHVSTVAVYGGLGGLGGLGGRWRRIAEDAPTDAPLAQREVYARSKRMAEDVAWGLHRAGALDVRVIRPCLVYGERDRIVLPRMARYLRMPVTLIVGRGTNPLPVVYAGNVADGAVLALVRPEASGRAYNLASDFPVAQKEFLAMLARGLGTRPRFVHVPFAAAYALGWLWHATGVRGVRGGSRRRVRLTPRAIALMARPNPFVSDRARQELGWTPRVRPAEAIRRAVDWYVNERGDG
ncbi:MAG: NAD-dependent epimerase/dehydratase family protein [Gemmatimonadetes bacterium]|nr:NAD-dependent epimerase/dehydratase family protein [Gemmatimonadota bacterium]